MSGPIRATDLISPPVLYTNTEEGMRRTHSAMPLRAPVATSIDPVVSGNSQATYPPQTVSSVMIECLSERNPTYHSIGPREDFLASPSLYPFPALNPTTDTAGLDITHQQLLTLTTPAPALGRLTHPLLFGTTDFSPRTQLSPRLSSLLLLLQSAPAAEFNRSSFLQPPSPSIFFSRNKYLLNRLPATQNPSLHQPQPRISLRAASAYLSNQPPSSCPPGPQSKTPTSVAPVASTSALALAATAGELVLQFSKEEESLIPLVGGSESFPMVLHRVLAELELIGGNTNIAAFLPEGLSFQIKNQSLFEQQVLPVFFPRMKSFASFQRQLNLYDFRRIGGLGLDRGAYRHELFVRDYPGISCRMRRIKTKRSNPRPPPKSSKKKKAENVCIAVHTTSEI
jgi:hypothetical protein